MSGECCQTIIDKSNSSKLCRLKAATHLVRRQSFDLKRSNVQQLPKIRTPSCMPDLLLLTAGVFYLQTRLYFRLDVMLIQLSIYLSAYPSAQSILLLQVVIYISTPFFKKSSTRHICPSIVFDLSIHLLVLFIYLSILFYGSTYPFDFTYVPTYGYV